MADYEYSCLLSLVICGVLLSIGGEELRKDGKGMLVVGLGGGKDYAFTKDFCRGIVKNSLFANLPQLVLTQLCLMFNNLFTRKAVCHEWGQFGIR